jgi:hypothetical protein
MIRQRCLVAAATAASRTLAATGTLSCLVDVLQIRTGYGVYIESHNRIRQSITLVGFYPRLEIATAHRAGKHCKSQYNSTCIVDSHNHIPNVSLTY